MTAAAAQTLELSRNIRRPNEETEKNEIRQRMVQERVLLREVEDAGNYI